MTICSQKVILRTLSMRTLESSPNINQRPDKMRDVRVTELIDEAKEPSWPRRSSYLAVLAFLAAARFFAASDIFLRVAAETIRFPGALFTEAAFLAVVFFLFAFRGATAVASAFPRIPAGDASCKSESRICVRRVTLFVRSAISLLNSATAPGTLIYPPIGQA
ncbi:hypothetical protein ACPOL_6327 [Acidisarcina polymorpha]|uniref:Uncharacterized protein n=1 Tax=Acidisarcina polymorpha TaxID=2211140 RepID=A0A2Z5G8V9_9BACT|nr:hypothetical protein ACPOL_6327 [Acidisarcina polymorpha]